MSQERYIIERDTAAHNVDDGCEYFRVIDTRPIYAQRIAAKAYAHKEFGIIDIFLNTDTKMTLVDAANVAASIAQASRIAGEPRVAVGNTTAW